MSDNKWWAVYPECPKCPGADGPGECEDAKENHQCHHFALPHIPIREIRAWAEGRRQYIRDALKWCRATQNLVRGEGRLSELDLLVDYLDRRVKEGERERTARDS